MQKGVVERQYEAMITALKISVDLLRKNEDRLTGKVENLQKYIIKFKGKISYLERQAKRLLGAIMRLLEVYSLFSSLDIKGKLLQIVSGLTVNFRIF